MVIQNELDKVMVFIEADRETKKAMATEWGHNIEEKATEIWDKSSVKVVDFHTEDEFLNIPAIFIFSLIALGAISAITYHCRKRWCPKETTHEQ